MIYVRFGNELKFYFLDEPAMVDNSTFNWIDRNVSLEIPNCKE